MSNKSLNKKNTNTKSKFNKSAVKSSTNNSKSSFAISLKLKIQALSKLRAKLSAKNKSKTALKEMQFNMSMPWGETIASYLGTTLDELKANMPADPTLNSAVQSTCGLVRDQSIKSLVAKNQKAYTVFKDICQGGGQVLNNKKLVMTGGCKWSKAPKAGALALGDGVNEIVGTCENMPTPFVFKRSAEPAPATPTPPKTGLADRLFRRGDMSLGGVSAEAPAAFLQKTGQTSNDELPDYLNSTLSGKGFTLNASPLTRNVPAALSTHQHKSYQAAPAEGSAETVAEEDAALGGDTQETLIESERKPVVPITIPDWFCPVVCAGLDMDYLFDGQAMVDEPLPPSPKPESPPAPAGPNVDMIGEENLLINTGRLHVDPLFKKAENGSGPQMEEGATVGAAKDANGHYKCSGVLPVSMTCLEVGDQIAEWFLERVLNNKVMCDYKKGSCNSLFL